MSPMRFTIASTGLPEPMHRLYSLWPIDAKYTRTVRPPGMLIHFCIATFRCFSPVAFRWSKESTQCVRRWARHVPVKFPAFAGNSVASKLPPGPFSFFFTFFHVLKFFVFVYDHHHHRHLHHYCHHPWLKPLCNLCASAV